MYIVLEKWLNSLLEEKIEGIEAYCFNLYEDGNYNWSMELVGTSSFDKEDPDWAWDEVTTFGTRENPLHWNQETGWEEVLDNITNILKVYINNGKYADELTSKAGVGVGFVDGDIRIVCSK